MSNPYLELVRLLPRQPLLVGEVLAHNADGTSTIELPGGQQIRVRGQSVPVAQNAFVQGNEVRGAAPALSPITIEV